MKSSVSRVLLASFACLFAVALKAQTANAVAGAPLAATDPVQIESMLIAKAHALASTGTAADVSSLLAATSSPFRDPIAPSVLIARRTMAVCGWLQSDNEYGRAMKLAQNVVTLLGNMKETTATDHEERLYWEGLLEGWVLDQKARAIELLEAARKLNPDDDRVLELEHEMVAAVAAFGR